MLDLAIADLLMRQFPNAKEGPLSKLRASIVNARTLALKAQALPGGSHLRLGKGRKGVAVAIKSRSLPPLSRHLSAPFIPTVVWSPQRVVEFLFTGDIGGPAAERDYKPNFRKWPIGVFVRSRSTIGIGGRSRPCQRFTTRIRIGGRELGSGAGGSKAERAGGRAPGTRPDRAGDSWHSA